MVILLVYRFFVLCFDVVSCTRLEYKEFLVSCLFVEFGAQNFEPSDFLKDIRMTHFCS